jgi:hypothetical protein
VMMLTEEQILRAVDDALARVHEWDGSDVTAKLAAFGLDAHAIASLLRDRLAVYQPDDETTFIRAYVEGVVVGLQLAKAGSE